jgi:hypothetical protein
MEETIGKWLRTVIRRFEREQESNPSNPRKRLKRPRENNPEHLDEIGSVVLTK